MLQDNLGAQLLVELLHASQLHQHIRGSAQQD